MKELIYLIPPDVTYARLGEQIEAMAPRAIEGSTALYDYNRLLIERRRLWMRMNSLGPR